jgi:hypothetical protein
MALRFDQQDGSYDPSNETVRFHGHEDETRLTFAITGVALRDLAGLDEVEPEGYCRIFREHRGKIEAKAAALWQTIKAEHERQGTAVSTIDPIIIASMED